MIKLWGLSLILFGILIGSASSQESWDLGSSQDWLSVGPIYHTGPYYYPDYYIPVYYPSYYPIYHPVYYPLYDTYNYPHYYPRHHKNFDHFPLGTFGEFHGGDN